MKNKFWMENLKAIIAGSVVGLIFLGLIYWKFFMPQPPPPGYGPPPGGAAPGGGEGSTTQTQTHKHCRKTRLSKHDTPHIQIQTITQNTDSRRCRRLKKRRGNVHCLSFELFRLRPATRATSSPRGRRRCRRRWWRRRR